jgi:hypothetical protein
MGVMLSGCATQLQSLPSDNNDARPLVSPASLGATLAVNQIVRGAFAGRDATLNCVVTVRDGAMTVVGLTALGVRAFTLHYDGNKVAVEANLPIPPQLTPERLLADIQLVYWPLGALEPALAAAGWELTEPYANVRRLRRGDQLMAEIHYTNADRWQGRSWLVDLQHRYTLGIDSTLLPAR